MNFGLRRKRYHREEFLLVKSKSIIKIIAVIDTSTGPGTGH